VHESEVLKMSTDFFPNNIDHNFEIPQEEYKSRLTTLQNNLHELNIDIGIAYGTPYLPGDLLYLTGYEPQLENALVLISPEDLIVLGGPEGEGYAKEQMKIGKYRSLSELRLPDEDYPNTDFSKLANIIKELTKSRPVRVALLTDPGIFPINWDVLIRENLSDTTQIVARPNILRNMRAKKSQVECQAIGYAAKISVEGMRAMLNLLKSDIRELEIAAEADYAMKKMGASSFGWETIILSGERINTVVGRASNKIIRKGEIVLLGTSARFCGYSSTCGRTVVIGNPSKGQEEFLNHASNAYKLAVKALVYGAPQKNVDLAPREYLRKQGLDIYQLYSVAHGTGITECLEGEPFTQYCKGSIPNNLAVMIDLGLFNHPVYFGARLEDEYIIDDQGITHRLSDLDLMV